MKDSLRCTDYSRVYIDMEVRVDVRVAELGGLLRRWLLGSEHERTWTIAQSPVRKRQ